ncbi:hypothetical protein L210DRAFT_985103 [Boletus edulis BED1]|uniref:Uncharacterized protein n=1 Tax=Boletus edulis BED1 TaxID=1328754 RepID=A0AAD4G568_BOLED|nr:hypothetical protein L210DRAFT_985103 [Boletus edulis BED1]
MARAVLHLPSHSTRSQQPFHRGHTVHRYDSNPAGQHLGHVREHTDSDIILLASFKFPSVVTVILYIM